MQMHFIFQNNYFCPMSIDVIKSLHIIFVVCWFAGLFYIVRLFIYHTEALNKDDIERDILSKQYIIMERRLWWYITTPSMYLTVLFGIWILWLNFKAYNQPWLYIKIAFVVLLIVYHFACQKIMNDLIKNKAVWTSFGLRIWNEVATLFLVVIIFLVEMKSTMNWIYGVLGFLGLGVSLTLAIKLYKTIRENRKQNVNN